MSSKHGSRHDALKAICHPYLIFLFGVAVDPATGAAGIVMELMRGSLADLFYGKLSKGVEKMLTPQRQLSVLRGVTSGIDEKTFRSIGETLTTVPDGLEIHKTLGRILNVVGQPIDEAGPIEAKIKKPIQPTKAFSKLISKFLNSLE